MEETIKIEIIRFLIGAVAGISIIIPVIILAFMDGGKR